MKILHSADWHLDSPLTGRPAALRQALLEIPGKIAALCRSEACDLLLLAGDLFDGPYSGESLRRVREAFSSLKIPVVIAPGNHDFYGPDSPYFRDVFPENVHIFQKTELECLELPELDCAIYGAGYTGMDCPNLLAGFRAEGPFSHKIGLLHADPVQSDSPYCPLKPQDIRDSDLSYLALGHCHKPGSFRAGDTLCAWPGCPMGRGFDEEGVHGVLLAELSETVSAQFLPLNTPRFYEVSADVEPGALEAASAVLPPVESQDFYRLTLTGYCPPVDREALQKAFLHLPNLEIRDKTLREADLWGVAGEDSLEGLYFQKLKDALDTDSEVLKRRIRLAAALSRQILDGQEVTLP